MGIPMKTCEKDKNCNVVGEFPKGLSVYGWEWKWSNSKEVSASHEDEKNLKYFVRM